MSPVRFHLFGPLGAEADRGPIDLGSPKQRAVLAVLLLNANEIVSTDRIIEQVWGDDAPRTADHSVQIYVSELRKAMSNGAPSDLIETRPPGYVLNTPPETIDAKLFERLIRNGLTAVRTGDLARGQPMLVRALDLWSQPLADFAYEDFAVGYARSLAEMRADALEALSAVHLDRNDLEQARECARAVIESDPLREEPRRLMMLALYRSGRQVEALRAYGEYQGLLAEELGIDPSPALKDLEERILLQDPTLVPVESPTDTFANPYRGLRPFTEEDADLYFGREDLVEEVLKRFDGGSRFVSIVGPSGCGKSSAAFAGITPRLRADGATVVSFQPGARPLWELAGALDRAGFGSRATLLRRLESEPGFLAALVTRPLVLVVDQFEELFTLAAPDLATRFGQQMARAAREPACRLQVLTTLRADYYDRPLSMPDLAEIFADAAVSVKPMTPKGIERAVVEPARAVGKSVEPDLLAQLVADMVDEPGALPLLQFSLFELFGNSDGALTLDDYGAIGGLHGALARGAEETLQELDAEGRGIVEQLFMRMVHKGRALATARPAALREILDLGDDRVALQQVLEAFGARRLLTFGRDASGAAVVEIAHEYLITEWPQLGAWIEEHSEDLDKLAALGFAAAEWVDNDRSEDYLLRGNRLTRTQEWRSRTAIRLTRGEREFVDTSAALREKEVKAATERQEQEDALSRKARRRLWLFGASLAALAAVATLLAMTLLPEPPPDVIVWYEGRTGPFGEMIGMGIDTAVQESGLVVQELTQLSDAEVVEEQVSAGTGLVFIDLGKALNAGPGLPLDHPDVQFVIIDCNEFGDSADLPANVSCIDAENGQVGFVAGAAAGLATESGRVGFIGGVESPVIHAMRDGFRAGVSYVAPATEIDVVYLSGFTPPSLIDMSGWRSPALAELAAEYLYSTGVDVVFHAAGASGDGLFKAAAEFSESSGNQVWAIGVDYDQYENLGFDPILMPIQELDPDGLTYAGWREHLLTSALKRIEVGVAEALVNYANTGSPGDVVIGLHNGGVGYATSGGFVDPLVPAMEAAIQALLAGEVTIEVDYEEPVLLLADLLRDDRG